MDPILAPKLTPIETEEGEIIDDVNASPIKKPAIHRDDSHINDNTAAKLPSPSASSAEPGEDLEEGEDDSSSRVPIVDEDGDVNMNGVGADAASSSSHRPTSQTSHKDDRHRHHHHSSSSHRSHRSSSSSSKHHSSRHRGDDDRSSGRHHSSSRRHRDPMSDTGAKEADDAPGNATATEVFDPMVIDSSQPSIVADTAVSAVEASADRPSLGQSRKRSRDSELVDPFEEYERLSRRQQHRSSGSRDETPRDQEKEKDREGRRHDRPVDDRDRRDRERREAEYARRGSRELAPVRGRGGFEGDREREREKERERERERGSYRDSREDRHVPRAYSREPERSMGHGREPERGSRAYSREPEARGHSDSRARREDEALERRGENGRDSGRYNDISRARRDEGRREATPTGPRAGPDDRNREQHRKEDKKLVPEPEPDNMMEEEMDEDKLIEERRKRRQAILEKYKSQGASGEVGVAIATATATISTTKTVAPAPLDMASPVSYTPEVMAAANGKGWYSRLVCLSVLKLSICGFIQHSFTSFIGFFFFFNYLFYFIRNSCWHSDNPDKFCIT